MSQSTKKIFEIKDSFIPTVKKKLLKSPELETAQKVKSEKGVNLSILTDLDSKKSDLKNSDLKNSQLKHINKNTQLSQSQLKHINKNTDLGKKLAPETSPSIEHIKDSSFISNTSFLNQVEGATMVMDAPLYQTAHQNTKNLCSCLVCLLGPTDLTGKSWPINKEKLTVGRSQKCDIYIPEASLSKKHLLIYQKDNKISIEDQKSTNGTFINKKPLKAYTLTDLKDNDKVRLGKMILRFLDKDNPEVISIQENFAKVFQDPLTQIGNRLALESQAPTVFNQSRQYLTPFSLILFDIDHFKKVNDTYGHLAGDFVLKEVVRVIRPCFRSKDLFARSGGEEFCIIIQSQKSRAESAIQKARQRVEKHLFQYKNKKINVTISAGVAYQQKKDKSWKSVYERADQRLYKSKTTGRNKVCSS